MKARDSFRPSVPTNNTTFVGRALEMAALRDAIDAGERLVTLFGPAGAGKTRLACELARSPDFLERAWFCDLAEVKTGDDVVSVVAHLFEVPILEREPAEIASRLGRALAGHEAPLVIMDSCEHVVDALVPLLEHWIRTAPEARFVLTSRERLGIDCERSLRVDPLGLPAEGASSRDVIAASEAVALFVARARRAAPDFELTDDGAMCVAELVRRLDGLPLAIELAAARLEVMGLDALLERLPRGPELLRRSGRGGNARHAALSTAIDWSWNLLSATEQRTLVRSTAFVDTFSLDAAEDVLALAAEEDDAPHVVDVMQRLVAKSLVVSEIAEGGERRFRVYATIRAYANSQLRGGGVLAEAEARHAAYYAELAHRALHADPDALSRQAFELPNILAAVRRSLELPPRSASSGSSAAAMLLALRPLMISSGPFPWCLELVSRVADREPDDSPLLPRVLALRGFLESLTGQVQRGLETMEAARRLAAGVDPRSRAEVELASGTLVARKGDVQGAETHYACAEELAAVAEDHALRAECIARRALLRSWLGHPAGAVDDVHRALDLARSDPATRATIMYFAGWIHLQLGQHAEAEKYLKRAATDMRHLRRRRMSSAIHVALGELGLDRLAPDAAERDFDATLAIARQTADLLAEAGARMGKGLARILRGEMQAADAELEQSLSIVEALENHRGVAQILAFRAYVAAREGRGVDARRWIERAVELARSIDDGLMTEVAPLAEAVAHLGVELASGEPPTSRRRATDVGVSLVARLSRRLRDAITATADKEVDEIPPEDALIIDPDGRWFQWAGQPRTSVERSAALASLLRALVQVRLDGSGRMLTLDECFAALAPEEQARFESKANRVYVAMARLRKLGLRGAIVGTRRGYALSSDLRVVAARRTSDFAPVKVVASEFTPISGPQEFVRVGKSRRG